MASKVVSQCSGCDNPICDGDRYVHTDYGDFCADCYTIETAVYHEDTTLDDFFGDIAEQLKGLTIHPD